MAESSSSLEPRGGASGRGRVGGVLSVGGALVVLGALLGPGGLGVAVGRGAATAQPAPTSPPPSSRPKAEEPPDNPPSDTASDEGTALGVDCRRHLDELLAEFGPARAGTTPRPRFEALIATLPDPLGALDYAFDRGLASLQRAVEVHTPAGASESYHRERFYLPWADEHAGATPKRCVDEVPGVLLFRARTGDSSSVLALFVVTESPTIGVDRKPLRTALARIADIAQLPRTVVPSASATDGTAAAPHARPSLVLPIVGPYFSGTSPSLSEAMKGAASRRPGLTFRVLTGAATNPGNRALLAIKDVSTFAALVHPDDLTLAALREFLLEIEGRGRPDAREHSEGLGVALLAESSTAYGAGLDRAADVSPPLRTDLVVPFPLHVSRIRREQQRQADARKAPADPTPAALGDDRELIDVADGERESRDTVAPIGARTAASEDIELLDALDALCGNTPRIRYAIIGATDVFDRLFLTRQLRHACPNVRPVLLVSDNLYTHPGYADDVDGALVVSSYPPFSAGFTWTHPFHADRVREFPSSTEVGLFNAALVALGDERSLVGYSGPLRAPDEQDEKAPVPPVWISVLARGAHWPVGLRAGNDDDGYLYRRVAPVEHAAAAGSGAPRRESAKRAVLGMPRSTFFVFTGSTLLVLYLGFAFLIAPSFRRDGRFGNLRKLPAVARFMLAATDGKAGGVEARVAQAQRRTATLFFAAVAFLYGLMAWFWWLALRPPSTSQHIEMSMPLAHAVLAAAAVVAFLLAAGCMVLAMARRDPGRLSLADGIPLAVIVVLLAVAARALNWYQPDAPGTWLAFWHRNVHLLGGASVLAPALAFGSLPALFLYGWLGRLDDLAPRSVRLPFPDDDERLVPSAAGLRRLASRVTESLLNPFRGGRGLPALVAVTLGFLVAIVGSGLQTLDFRPWRILLYAALVVAFAVTAAQFAWAVYLWRDVRELLRRFAGHPLLGAFGRLPSRLASHLGVGISPQRPGLMDVAFAVEQLATLEAEWNAEDSPVRKIASEFTPAATVAGAGTEPVAATPSLVERASEVLSGVPELRRDMLARIEQESERDGGTEATAGSLQARVAGLVADLGPLLDAFYRWRSRRRPIPAVADEKDEVPHSLALQAREWKEPEGITFFRLLEEVTAGQVTFFVFDALVHLRSLLAFVTGGLVLLLAGATSYRFEPHQVLLNLLAFAVVIVVGASVAILLQIERDQVLSRVSKTNPGEVDWGWPLARKLLSTGAVPLLGLVATRLPGLGRALLELLGPILQVAN